MAKGTDDYIFFMCLEGAASFTHLGREASIEAGQAILLSSSDPHVIERAMSRHLFITIPKAALGPMAANADAALMTPISCAGEKFGLLASYVRLLMQEGRVDTASALSTSIDGQGELLVPAPSRHAIRQA